MWGIVQQRRLQSIRTGVFFALAVSLLLPHPAVIFAQEATPEVEADASASPEASTPDTPAASEDAAEPAGEVAGTEEAEAMPEEGAEEGGEEPPPEGLLDDEDPDSEYGDERAPRVRQPSIEPDQLDGSLRYLHPLVIPPDRHQASRQNHPKFPPADW